MPTVENCLEHGAKYPYDNRQPIDAAHCAALGVIANLRDRRGVRQELEQIEDDIRIEIVDELAIIIRLAGLTAL